MNQKHPELDDLPYARYRRRAPRDTVAVMAAAISALGFPLVVLGVTAMFSAGAVILGSIGLFVASRWPDEFNRADLASGGLLLGLLGIAIYAFGVHL